MLEDFFGDGGLLSRNTSNYEMRPSQVEMARAWNSAIVREATTIVEAPTGCGKSFAYSVPLIAAIKTQKIKAVIVTANINLQEQLIEKDLPFLREVSGIPFSIGLLKGRNNYVCLMKLHNVLKQQLNSQETTLISWAQNSETGDKSELVDTQSQSAVWSKFAGNTAECLGRDCDHHDECFCNRARRRALASDIIVTNYHLMLVGHTLIKEMDALVCDEAHNIARIARDAIGWQLNMGSVSYISSRMNKIIDSKDFLNIGKNLFRKLSSKIRNKQHMSIRDWDVQIDYNLQPWKQAISEASEQILEIARQLKDANNKSGWSKAMAVDKMLDGVMDKLISLENCSEEWAMWIEGPSEHVALKGAPIQLDKIVPPRLFDKARAVLLTSATLTTGGRTGFEFVKHELGIKQSSNLAVSSPFNLKRQGLLIFPTDVPNLPKDRRMSNVAKNKIEQARYNSIAFYANELIKKYNGRCLFLFTSWKALNEVYKRIADCIPTDITLHRQVPLGNKKLLLDAFRDDETSVLMGVASFWEGVDIQGASLSGLLIDKLPFPVPGYPINDAICNAIKKRGGDPFKEFAIPSTILQLCQGLGRLIRTKNDTGTAVITDSRITAPWAATIRKGLPDFRVVSGKGGLP